MVRTERESERKREMVDLLVLPRPAKTLQNASLAHASLAYEDCISSNTESVKTCFQQIASLLTLNTNRKFFIVAGHKKCHFRENKCLV